MVYEGDVFAACYVSYEGLVCKPFDGVFIRSSLLSREYPIILNSKSRGFQVQGIHTVGIKHHSKRSKHRCIETSINTPFSGLSMVEST